MTTPTRPLVGYRELDAAKIDSTLRRLRDRIGERFPGSGLSQVSAELVTLADEANACVAYLRRPIWAVRVGVFFLLGVETRLKRRRVLEALHELRSVVHIIDMHQLTKDPERLMVPREDTAASPRRSMTPPELGRYLDYCSELLSLTSKLAALFVQHFKDPVVLAAVNEIETLVTGLSGKIWQKIGMLERIVAREPGATS